MMRLLSCLVIMLGLLFISSEPAQAQQQVGAQTDTSKVHDQAACEALRGAQTSNSSITDQIMWAGGTICPCTPSPSRWIERVVSCFAEVPGGLLHNSVLKVSSSPAYSGFRDMVVNYSILLALVLFGISLITGSIHSLPKQSFTLILKIAGVILFFDNFGELYGAGMDAIIDLTNKVESTLGNMADFCDGVQSTGTLWARWDCLVMKLTGLIGGQIVLGIIGFMTAMLFSGGTGVAIFFGLAYIIMSILLIAMRTVYTYLVALIAVSFLFLLAPLFVPLIFFGQTYMKFATWFKLILAYVLQPMLLFLFMVLMLVAFEFAIFVGPTSLFAALSNASPPEPSKSMSFSEVMQINAGGGGIIPNIAVAVSGNGKDFSKHIKPKPVFGSTVYTDPGVHTANPNQPDNANMQGTDAALMGPMSTANPNAQVDPDSSIVSGYLLPSVDYDGAAQHVGHSDPNVWVTNIMTQITAVSILVFILYNLIHAVPQITHDLVAQNFGRGFGSASKARMIGESEIRKSLAGSKEMARRGKKSGDKKGAAQTVMQETFDSMVGRR